MNYIQTILNMEHAISTDGERLYVSSGDVYLITYDYHDNSIADLTLISEYN
jgi:hypothetical protein